ncbi:hypothetical protein V8C86DRAFT_1185900 [Haematococcus lacustris]
MTGMGRNCIGWLLMGLRPTLAGRLAALQLPAPTMPTKSTNTAAGPVTSLVLAWHRVWRGTPGPGCSSTPCFQSIIQMQAEPAR